MLKRLFQSRKAFVTILTVVVGAILVKTGSLRAEDYAQILKILIPAWLGSQALEDIVGKAKNGNGNGNG